MCCRKVALVCLLLTLWSAVGLAAHHHSSRTEAARCSVCVALHSAAPKGIATLPQTMFAYASAPVLDTISVQQRLNPFALRVRPPPSV
jgi:hypothetical protein